MIYPPVLKPVGQYREWGGWVRLKYTLQSLPILPTFSNFLNPLLCFFFLTFKQTYRLTFSRILAFTLLG